LQYWNCGPTTRPDETLCFDKVADEVVDEAEDKTAGTDELETTELPSLDDVKTEIY